MTNSKQEWEKDWVFSSGDLGMCVQSKSDLKAGIPTRFIPIKEFINNLLQEERQRVVEIVKDILWNCEFTYEPLKNGDKDRFINYEEAVKKISDLQSKLGKL